MKIAVVLGVMLIGSPVLADMKAGDFSKACRSAQGSAEDQQCAAYVNGLAAGILVDQAARADGASICLPEGVSTHDLRETLKAYLGDPTIAQLPAGGFITAALQAAYKCRGPLSPLQTSASRPQ